MTKDEQIALLRAVLSNIVDDYRSHESNAYCEMRIEYKSLEEAEEALAATSQPAQESGERDAWQPIENPPEKWTEVTVWPHPSEYRMVAEFDGVGWRYSEQDRDGAFWSAHKPTHWMPLPKPPKEVK